MVNPAPSHRSSKCLRILAIVLGVGLALGEAIRSWGAHRSFFSVIDDFLMAAFLFLAAGRSGRRGGHAWLAAAFGFASGMLYASFFEHVSLLNRPDPGNIPQHSLTALIGLAFAGALLGLALALRAACTEKGSSA